MIRCQVVFAGYPVFASTTRLGLGLDFFIYLLIFKDSPTGKGTLVEGVSVGRWNYMFP